MAGRKKATKGSAFLMASGIGNILIMIGNGLQLLFYMLFALGAVFEWSSGPAPRLKFDEYGFEAISYKNIFILHILLLIFIMILSLVFAVLAIKHAWDNKKLTGLIISGSILSVFSLILLIISQNFFHLFHLLCWILLIIGGALAGKMREEPIPSHMASAFDPGIKRPVPTGAYNAAYYAAQPRPDAAQPRPNAAYPQNNTQAPYNGPTQRKESSPVPPAFRPGNPPAGVFRADGGSGMNTAPHSQSPQPPQRPQARQTPNPVQRPQPSPTPPVQGTGMPSSRPQGAPTPQKSPLMTPSYHRADPPPAHYGSAGPAPRPDEEKKQAEQNNGQTPQIKEHPKPESAKLPAPPAPTSANDSPEEGRSPLGTAQEASEAEENGGASS